MRASILAHERRDSPALRGLQRALQHAGAEVDRGSDHALSDYRRHYERHGSSQTRVYPAVRETLSALRAVGTRLALVSNKERLFVLPLLDAHELRDCFDLLVFGDTLPVRKPDPRPLRHCLEHFGVLPSRALMVGDSATDVVAARRAGIAAWAVSYGYNHGQPVAATGPERVIDSCAELAEAFAPFFPSCIHGGKEKGWG